jgi:hypothetical protein
MGKVLRTEEDITSGKFGIAIGFQRSQVLADG